jgi:Zn-dependent membrane protease YugP
MYSTISKAFHTTKENAYVKKYFSYSMIVMSVIATHNVTTYIYYSHCTMTFNNFFLPISPVCSYLLYSIRICSDIIIKMFYALVCFVILHATTLFNRLNLPNLPDAYKRAYSIPISGSEKDME